MNEHRLSPETALLRKEWEITNQLAWKLRRITGGALKLALQMSVPEGLREDVEKRVEFIQRKHQKGKA